MSLPVASPAAQQPALPAALRASGPVPAHKALNAADASAQKKADEKKGFSFFDFLDIVNPLQHIPVVSAIYRELTGDEIKGSARVIGGAIFGGPVGAILGGVNALVAAEHNGKDVGALAMNKIGVGSDDGEETTSSSKDDKNLPVVEVHPSDGDLLLSPIDQMPFARVGKNEILWDDAVNVAQNTMLPEAKHLNDLKPVAGMEPKFDAALDDVASLNDIEPGIKENGTVAVNIPAAPVDTNKIPDLMAQAMAKYQAMQSLNDKAAVVADPEAGIKTRKPFAGLADLRHYSN